MEKKIKIFITGSSGYIGSNILSYLSKLQKYDITCLEHLKTNSPRPQNVNYINGNILEPEKFENFIKGSDIFIHTAAEVNFLNSKKLIQINFESLKKILKICDDHNVKKFINFSSRGTRDVELNPSKTNENCDFLDFSKADDYLKSKIMGEKYIQVFRGKTNMNIINILPTTVAGGTNFQSTLLSKFLKNKANKNFVLYFSGGLNIIDIQSFLKGFKNLLESNFINEDYFFSGINISFFELFKKITKKSCLFIKIPSFLILMVILLFEKVGFVFKIKLGMTYNKAKINLKNGTFCSNKKAKESILLPETNIDKVLSELF